MDDAHTVLVLKELRRIKWLLVLITIGFLVLPVSLLYVGWEIASILIQQGGTDEQEGFEAVAEGLMRESRFEELTQVLERRARTHPDDARRFWYRARLAIHAEEWDRALQELETLEQRDPRFRRPAADTLLRAVRAHLSRS